MQATAFTYDPESRSGSVLLDDGTPLPFDAAAFDAGGLLRLRPGQRVRIETAPEEKEAEGAESAQDTEGDEGKSRDRRIVLVTLQTL